MDYVLHVPHDSVVAFFYSYYATPIILTLECRKREYMRQHKFPFSCHITRSHTEIPYSRNGGTEELVIPFP